MAGKNIIRKDRNRENPYAQIYKDLLNDGNLSYKARGIAGYILSKPDDWVVIISDLVKNSTDGEKAVRSGLKELKETRYLQRYAVYENGKVAYWESILSEEPYRENEMIHCIKKQLDINGNIIKEDIVYKVDKGKEDNDLLCQNRKVAQTTENKGVDLLSQNVKVGNVEVEKVNVENDRLLINDNTNNDFNNNDLTDNLEEKEKEGAHPQENNISEIVKLFNENICKLKPIQLQKFREIVKHFDMEYIKTIIEVCADYNINSYRGFKVVLNEKIDKGLDTAEKIKKQIIKYEIESQDLRDKERKKRKDRANNKSSYKEPSAFNNYEQRKYDFDDLEKKLLGWDNENNNETDD